jgi:cytochrome c oxidase assembly protein subunit 15
MGINGVIEFTNRTLTFVLAIIAIAGFVLAIREKPRRRRVVRLSLLVALSIPAQAVLGGVTVLTHLNPWVVGSHFLLSMAIIAATYAFWRSTFEPSTRDSLPGPLRTLVVVLTAASGAVLVVGTMVTGSGPHAGDANARRNGLDPQAIAQVHADLVFLLVGVAVAAWLALRAVGAGTATVRAGWLVGVILAQGVVGFAQYFTHLPVILVGVHMAGACAVWLATLAVLWAAYPKLAGAGAQAELGAAASPIASVTTPSPASTAKTGVNVPAASRTAPNATGPTAASR